MSELVDFHVHYSDSSGRAIIDKAKLTGVVGLGLLGRAEISDEVLDWVNYGKEKGIEVFPGVEYLAKVGDKRVDLVALGFDHFDPIMRKYFGKAENIQRNAEIALRQHEFMLKRGVSFDGLNSGDSELLELLLGGKITEKAIKFCQVAAHNGANGNLLGQLKHDNENLWNEVIEKYASREPYARDPYKLEAKFLWKLWFDVDGPGYIPVQSDAGQVISSVQKAGGAILYSPEGKFDEKVWQELIGLGIDGIMAWHGGELEISPSIARETRSKGLLILGGGDFNPERDEWKIGEGRGNMYISPRRMKELEKYLTDRRNGLEKR